MITAHDTPSVSDVALRKAAILVAALDTDSADALLQRMGAERAELVRNTILQLGSVSEQEERLVLDEFISAGGAARDIDDGGVELAGSLAAEIAASGAASDGETQTGDLPELATPFQFLQDTTAEQLVPHLRGEHPQLIAVVVAHLPSNKAAELIKRLIPTLQVSVLRRVAELDTTSPEVLRDVERELELLLSDHLDAARQRSAGLAAVATILDAAGTERSELLANVTQHDRSLAIQLGQSQLPAAPVPTIEKRVTPVSSGSSSVEYAKRPVVRPQRTTNRDRNASSQRTWDSDAQPDHGHDHPAQLPEIEFASLSELEPSALAVLFRQIEPQISLLALVGANAEFLERILQHVPAREAKLLQRKMQAMGPLKLTDIERAQRRVARKAAELLAAGRLVLPKSKRFAAAA